jgi:hypothetical protein
MVNEDSGGGSTRLVLGDCHGITRRSPACHETQRVKKETIGKNFRAITVTTTGDFVDTAMPPSQQAIGSSSRSPVCEAGSRFIWSRVWCRLVIFCRPRSI